MASGLRAFGKLLGMLVGAIGRLAALLLALALILPVVAIVYTTTDDFRARLLAWALPELDRRMQGELTIERLEGSPLGTLRIEKAALRWHGAEIARFDAAAVELDWSALLLRQVRIARIEIERPRVVFVEHPSAGWDWRQALAPLVPAPDDERPDRPPAPVVIEQLALSQAILRIEPLAEAPIDFEGIALSGRVDFPARRVELARASLETAHSKLEARGEIPFRDPWRIEVDVHALHPSDLARFSPTLAESLAFLPAATGRAVVEGAKRSIRTNGELGWPEAQLAFDARGEPNPFALRRATIDAHLRASRLERFLPSAPFAGALDLELALAAGVGTFRASLQPGGDGALTLAGELAIAEGATTSLRFEAERFDPARFMPSHPEWRGALSGQGTLALSGRDPASLKAELAATLADSRIGALSIRRARLAAQQDGDTIRLEQLLLESPIGHARVRGRLGVDPSAEVALAADLDVADLRPLLALFRQSGAGSLRGTLSVEGRRDDARLSTDLALAGFAIGDLTLARVGILVAARGRFLGDVDAEIQSLRVDLPIGRWQLEAPTRLRATRTSLELDRARLASAPTRLSLDGRLARSGPQRFALTATGVPAADWVARWSAAAPGRRSLGWLTRGQLDLDLTVGGTAARPTLALALRPDELAVRDRAIETSESTLRYDGQTLRGTLSAATDPALSLEAEAALPYRLAWADAFIARPSGALDARARFRADELAFLEPFVEPSVTKLAGRGHGRLQLTGPLDALRPSGEVILEALTFRPRQSGVTVVEGELAVELAGDRIRLRRASATAAGHEATARLAASGEGPLPAFLARAAGLPTVTESDAAPYTTTIELTRWPLVDTKRDRLITSGSLSARGALEAPVIEGHVEIDAGTLRPNLAFLTSGPPPRDPTIVIERAPSTTANGADAAGESASTASGPSVASIVEALALDVRVDLGRELWIKHELAEVLLEGRVAATKRAGQPFSLDGRIDAQRGFADLQSRRFRLIEGRLEFVGGAKVDPELDVLGRYKAPDHTIDARLTGTASKPVLTLTADPTLSQEDILAVLLFGRPASELSDDQQTSLGQRASEMASALGITAVGRSVASAIGLESLGLQIDELSSRRASVGAYLGRNIFVALAQDFSGERGQELSIEYEFWPGWSVVGSTTTQGTNSADLVWKVRY